MSQSIFIKSMHPKSEIRPTPATIDKILKAGWVGQMKVHGHRAQIHLRADGAQPSIVYNRQGRPHKKLLPQEVENELRRVFHLKKGWTVIDAEWLKESDRLFIFDLLKLDDQSLRAQTYLQRWKLLPKNFISPFVKVLPLLMTIEKCMEIMECSKEFVEGLVFKSLNTKGFSDTSIVRCRKITDWRAL